MRRNPPFGQGARSMTDNLRVLPLMRVGGAQSVQRASSKDGSRSIVLICRSQYCRRVSPQRFFNTRGAALVIVLVSALIFSIAAFGVLTMAVSRAQQVDYVSETRIRARFAAEAGMVWATQRLWATPGWPPGCVPGNDQAAPVWTIDTDGAGPLPPTNVNVMVRNCGPGFLHTLESKVTLP